MTPLDYAIVVVYLAGMVALGAAVSTRIRGFKDYFLAGGALTTPLLICTLVSSYYGLDVTFGTSETGFYYGLVAWCWYSLPYYGFIALAALVVAPRLKRYEGAMTLSDILERHYGEPTRIVGAAACFVYSAPIVAMAGMIGVLDFLGVPPGWGLALSVGVCALYTIMGGMWADALSDTVQFVLMCVSLAVAIPLAVEWVGGWEFVERLPGASLPGGSSHLKSHGDLDFPIRLAWALTGLTVLIEPAFYQRVFAARDDRSVRHALLVGIFLWAAYDWGVTLIGLLAQAAVQQGLLPSDLPGRQALLTLTMTLLPTGLRGLMLGGILAAAMSTIDSYSLLASGNVVYDIYRPLFNPQASDRRLLTLTRWGVFLVMLAAAIIGLLFARMRDAWQFMTSVMTAGVLAPTLAALLWRPRRSAGLPSVLAGLGGVVAFYALLAWQGEYDPQREVRVWRLAGLALWQDYAALCALPLSLAGLLLGHWWGDDETADETEETPP